MPSIVDEKQIEYLKQFKKEDNPLILEMEQFAKEHKIPILDWLAVQYLEFIIKTNQPKMVLEIGTAIAYSTIRIARSLPEDGTVITLEKSEPNIVKAKDYISRSELGHKITILHGEALELIPSINSLFDLIFLDADKEDYLDLLKIAIPKLKENGILFVDNLLWHGYTAAKDEIPSSYVQSTEYVREFNQLFMNHPELDSIIVPLGDGIGIGRKNK